jgi:hypothetical protein
MRFLSRARQREHLGIAEGDVARSCLENVRFPTTSVVRWKSCFYHISSFNVVAFGPDSEIVLPAIGVSVNTFRLTPSMIPKNAEVVGRGCFSRCWSPAEVSIEDGSRPRAIAMNVFFRRAHANVGRADRVEDLLYGFFGM